MEVRDDRGAEKEKGLFQRFQHYKFFASMNVCLCVCVCVFVCV